MSYMGSSIGLGIFSFLGLVIYLGFLVLVIYLTISIIQFFKRKIEIDKALLVKLDTLIQLQAQKKGHPAINKVGVSLFAQGHS